VSAFFTTVASAERARIQRPSAGVCLVIAESFYEWKTLLNGRTLYLLYPYEIRSDEAVFEEIPETLPSQPSNFH
jgi:hypothetical protein